ncbi:NifU family protein [Sandaracinobacter sp. RS1-74]|uniref:NifU family protein n=1 Tax=Sandaracinobacteroides sayramensis TaxID=2913411 RepID=UPI001EDBB5DA|nr:NifU family protein [Sandaracinobacteroides sayramensis]MCG2840113.1 NifU family protein [Sandaracinobacteroides sayramensis]
MLIETERTPNPATLKFLPGQPVLPGEGADFDSPEAAERSPLARALFALGDVERVYFGADFVSVTKAPGSQGWETLKPDVLGLVMDHFASGVPLIAAEAGDAETFDDPEDADIVAQIRELLDTRIRPAVANDGGDIVYRGFQKGVVYLHMRGSCAGCPSSTATLKGGIENLLRYYVPEVVEVRAV